MTGLVPGADVAGCGRWVLGRWTAGSWIAGSWEGLSRRGGTSLPIPESAGIAGLIGARVCGSTFSTGSRITGRIEPASWVGSSMPAVGRFEPITGSFGSA